ncbi:hypothetical protein VKT23_009156 [Stygiomarasmius scandens]|uniref:Uncharacterized protein n=1 Tax=Marasmiellus scandens TaxID=2682957 RepID=A0ABR1JEL8_9AGAR
MKATRSLLLSCLLALAAVHAAEAARNYPRQQGGGLGIIGNDDETTSTTSTTTSSSSSTTSSSSSTTSTSSSTSTTSESTTSNTSATTSASNTSAQTSASTTNPAQSPSTTPPPQPSTVTSTNAQGQTTFVVVTNTPSGSATEDSANSPTNSSDSSNGGGGGDSDGLGTGSIIGLSVAGGVAAIGIIAFFVWKFTRKRFTDFDDNEAIKWPELNAHNNIGGADSHPLPVHNTGRAGFDTGSEVSLSRAPSNNTHTNYSTSDLAPDPYAVPPLPHLNPSQPQPYRDDPGAAGAYYDPYRGPVPGAFSDHGHEWGHGGEAIPMTQMVPPGMSIGRVASPAPSIARQMTPAPGLGYDMGRRSPGPQMMMGRASPAPGAYGDYGAR